VNAILTHNPHLPRTAHQQAPEARLSPVADRTTYQAETE
jgi:hypothetical protein